jgi:EmrB/QacA subfamily drug resistance transporter
LAQVKALIPSEGAGSGSGMRWVLPATILGSSLSFIDGSVVNVALPVIQSNLHSTFAAMQWVISGYMLMLASLILLGGALGDRYGKTRVFIVGLALFAAASAACGAAPSASWLIVARLFQGVASALVVPASLAIISDQYSGAKRGKAIGTWAAAGGLMTAFGPPLGGWLVDAVGWRSIFFINPPIAVVAILLALKLPASANRTSSKPLDIPGSALVVCALALLSFGLIAIGEGSTIPGIVAVLVAIPIAAVFILVEARSFAAMMPLSLFRNRSFAGVNIITVILYAGLSGSLVLLPFMLIKVHGYSATAAGASLLPLSIIMGFGSRWAGGLSGKIGPRIPLIAGPLITGLGFIVLGVSGNNETYVTAFLPGLVIVALGMTLSIPALTTTVFDSAPDENSGMASGINNAAARSGGLIAVAALGLALEGSKLDSLDHVVIGRAYWIVMIAAAALSALSALCAALTIPRPVKQ